MLYVYIFSMSLSWHEKNKESESESNLLNVYKHKGLMPMFTNKDFNGWFQLCLLLNPFQNGLYSFGWLSVRNLLEFHVK